MGNLCDVDHCSGSYSPFALISSTRIVRTNDPPPVLDIFPLLRTFFYDVATVDLGPNNGSWRPFPVNPSKITGHVVIGRPMRPHTVLIQGFRGGFL